MYHCFISLTPNTPISCRCHPWQERRSCKLTHRNQHLQSPLPSHSPIRHLMLTPCGIFSLLIRPASPMQRCNAKHSLAPFSFPCLAFASASAAHPTTAATTAASAGSSLRLFLVPFVHFSGYPIFIQLAPSGFTMCCIPCSRPRRLPRRKGHLGSALPNAACCATPRQHPALAPATLAPGPVQTRNVQLSKINWLLISRLCFFIRQQ